MLAEIVFRENQESNSRFTSKDIPLEILNKRVKWPSYPLNALNYPILMESGISAECKRFLQDHAQLIIDQCHDSLSFWMVDMPINEFYPIYNDLVSRGENLDEIDPKIKAIFSRYLDFFSCGIFNTSDLVKAMDQTR